MRSVKRQKAPARRRPARVAAEGAPERSARGVPTLAIDIGGSGLKASVVDERGKLLVDRVRVDTPVGADPEVLVETLVALVKDLPAYERVSVGFPGVVRDGVILTAPNLGNEGWRGFDLRRALTTSLERPVRIANDADVQGLAVIEGSGVEMVVTLGTGFGTAIYIDGHLGPHLEIAHQPFRKGETYDQQIGEAARKKIGDKRWNRRVKKAIRNMRILTTFDRLYVGGGNAKRLELPLDPDVTIVANRAGIAGGIALWRD
jgi:polyphosphate glucokinase